MLLLVEVVVGKLLGIDLEEGTPLGEMLALLLGLELEMEPGEEKLQGLSISKWSWKVCCYHGDDAHKEYCILSLSR